MTGGKNRIIIYGPKDDGSSSRATRSSIHRQQPRDSAPPQRSTKTLPTAVSARGSDSGRRRSGTCGERALPPCMLGISVTQVLSEARLLAGRA